MAIYFCQGKVCILKKMIKIKILKIELRLHKHQRPNVLQDVVEENVSLLLMNF